MTMKMRSSRVRRTVYSTSRRRRADRVRAGPRVRTRRINGSTSHLTSSHLHLHFLGLRVGTTWMWRDRR